MPGARGAALALVVLAAACVPDGASSGSPAVDRPAASARPAPPGSVATDACGLARADEVAPAAKLPEVVVTARAVQWRPVREDLCGWGSPTSIGTYAVALALRTGVTPEAFDRERDRADEPPRFRDVKLPADATPQPVAALGDEAWSRVVYTVDTEPTASAVEVQVRFGREVLRVLVPFPRGATPEIGPAVALARVAAQRVDTGFDVPERIGGAPCDAISPLAVRRTLGVPVLATRAVVHEDGQAQCWFEGGDAFLEVVARRSPEAQERFAAERGTARRVDLGRPGLVAHYLTTPHQDGSLRIGDLVISLRGLTAAEAAGAVPSKPARRPSPADRGLLLAVAAAFS